MLHNLPTPHPATPQHYVARLSRGFLPAVNPLSFGQDLVGLGSGGVYGARTDLAKTQVCDDEQRTA